MDVELKQYLDAMTEGLKAQIDGPKAQIDGLKAQIDGLKAHVSGQIDAVEERLKAHTSQECEKVETKLLTEFHKWASPMELRVRSHATAMRALDLEIEDVKDRLTKLEPPSAAH